MPTFTTVELENLLEPRVRVSNLKQQPSLEDPNRRKEAFGHPRHLYVSSPALYSTPEQAPIPACSPPDPLSPSPYVVNHKRRRGGIERTSEASDLPLGDGDFSLEEEVVEDNSVSTDLVGNGEEEEEVAEEEKILDRTSEEKEVMMSCAAANQVESRSFVSAQGEFFDAIDEFSSDGSNSNASSCASRIESELHALRISLLDEIEKRKTAEETLALMHNQWERIRNLMHEAGLTFPAPPLASDSIQLYDDVIDQLSQEVVVTRFVAEAVGRGQARAEAEEVSASIIESKDQEILRLRDRLQYSETMNHELSQRKLVEVARRQQERKRSRQRWLWGLAGLSIAVGVSLASYSYFPQSSNDNTTNASSDSS